MNLEEQFIKETGLSSTIPNYITSDGYYSQEYVEWLEAKINYTHCCKSDSELLKCGDCDCKVKYPNIGCDDLKDCKKD